MSSNGDFENRSQKISYHFRRLRGGGCVVADSGLMPNARIIPGERFSGCGHNDLARLAFFALAEASDFWIRWIYERHVERIVENVMRAGEFRQLHVSAGGA